MEALMGTEGARARLWDPTPKVSALPAPPAPPLRVPAKEKAVMVRTTWGPLGHPRPGVQYVQPPQL